MIVTTPTLTVRLREPHVAQVDFLTCTAKRVILRAGRRFGKTTAAAILAVQDFLAGSRVLYTAPTSEQTEWFWYEVKNALDEPTRAGLYRKNETQRLIELPGTEQRIRAKTAWNADTLRGDFADLLIFDEWQLTNEDAWQLVGAPMLLDNSGRAVFIYTPPSVRSRGRSKAGDPMHAAKMFKRAKADETGQWAWFHHSSHDNPHLERAALDDITFDMTALAYEQEIMAVDREDAPGALWNRDLLEQTRVTQHPALARIVIGVDPATTATETSSETGILVCGIDENGEGYTLADITLKGSPGEWARTIVDAYYDYRADRIIGETNNGGDMIEHTIRTVDKSVSYKKVTASRGKHTRAEPIAALYERGLIHHVGYFGELEDQMCLWVPGDDSPDRMDALVWAYTELMLKHRKPPKQEPFLR